MPPLANTEQDPIDRSPPIAAFLSGEPFFKAGQCLHSAYEGGACPLRFQMPIYYLYCPALELVMKAFLLANGVPEKELRKQNIRHCLFCLWEKRLQQPSGLGLVNNSSVGAVIWILNPYATSFEFRYVQIGSVTLPTLNEVRDAAQELIAVVRPSCDNSVSS